METNFPDRKTADKFITGCVYNFAKWVRLENNMFHTLRFSIFYTDKEKSSITVKTIIEKYEFSLN